MVYKVYSGRAGGVFGDLITVEVDASTGLPGLEIIGLPGSEIREARDRVRIALKNMGVTLPPTRIIINLSPADEHKEGAGFDLPIAVSLLGVFGHIENSVVKESLIIGELSLDGKITGTNGVLPIVRMAREKGFKRVILPRDNCEEGALIKGIDIVPVDNLGTLIAYLSVTPCEGLSLIPTFTRNEVDFEPEDGGDDFSEVYGQENVKRAAMIAAAGFHHFLMIGPPGTGKSLIAKRIAGIMPALTYEESLEVTSIYSVAGKLDKETPFIKKRPFWAPHHGASSQAIVGGGAYARPGLVSLSHRGILFLDEMAEFKKETLDMLRQPMEDGSITVSRTKKTYSYPASFMLVGAMNPCPCGYYPDRNRCLCTDRQIEKYLSKISGPVLDRIDLCVEVARVNPRDFSDCRQGLSSEEMRATVEAAVLIQKRRYEKENFKFNSGIPSSKIEEYVALGAAEQEFMYSMFDDMELSMRSYSKMLRVARTIADISGEEKIRIEHLMEASCYRFPDFKITG